MVQLIGKGKALELLLSANMIDANKAKQLGLVNHVTTSETLMTETRKIMELINSKAPLAIAGCIKAVNAVFDETKDGYAVEVAEFGNAFATEDMKEGTSAFLEKRKAIFSGK
jgi:enoyl-CoA hydratase